MPGMGHSKEWWAMYEALRREGHSKESAARMTNAHFSKAKDVHARINGMRHK